LKNNISWAFKERIIGSKPAFITGEQQLPAKISSFKGKDSSTWVNNVSTYQSVTLGEVYNGIELRLVARSNNMEKLFYVHQGANPDDINLELSGCENLSINSAGQLEIETGIGTFAFTEPIAYQDTKNGREYVDIAYKLNDNIYGFEIGEYDRSRLLVIDPLLASTYLGGSENEGNVLSISMVLDNEGNVYVAGRTLSIDFPHSIGVIQEDNNGSYDIFISKLTPDLTTLLASTYLGGSSVEGERGSPDLILDDEGNLYVTGLTISDDFPTLPGAYREEDIGSYDIFISKLSSNLDSLLYSTYFGSSGFEQVNSIAIDQTGNVFIAGYTRSMYFPVTSGAFQETYYGTGGQQWGGEVFISKFSSDLSSLLASTYLGGSDWDEGGYLAIDESNNVYIVGSTRSGTTGSTQDFPTTEGACFPDYNGDDAYGGDGFVSLLSNDLTTLIASTYLGGNSNDWGYAIALGSDGNVYVTGHTPSNDFPTTTGAYNEDYNSTLGTEVGNDMYVSKFNSDLSTLLASTYLGTVLHEVALEITLDTENNVYIGGHANNVYFPTTPGCYNSDFNGGGFGYGGDIILACFNSDLSLLKSATYVGGNGQEDVGTIALDSEGNLYFCGATNSGNFPIDTAAFQNEYHGGSVDYWGGDIYVSALPSGYFSDADGDTVADISDNCINTWNREQEDLDSDGVGDSCDNCIDVYNPDQVDLDDDGVGDLCQYTCGDASNDGNVNILDVTFLISFLYKGGPAPESMWASDPNGDGSVNILDITYLISYLYKSGPAPNCL
jgi:hypothetical protein